MLKKTLLSLLLVSSASLLLFSCDTPPDASRAPETIRVACVGDSITFGAGIEGRWMNSYPSQLGALLGKGWEVRNFGVNNATVLKRGFYPYWQTREFKAALAYLPHVVVIKLGTNDARPWNWRYKDEFGLDYLDLVERFRALETSPRIWLCTPAPAYRGKGGGEDRVIQEEVIPLIRGIARNTGFPVIDLNKVLSGRRDLFPDGVHPDAQGARLIADTVYEAIAGETVNTSKPLRTLPQRSPRAPSRE